MRPFLDSVKTSIDEIVREVYAVRTASAAAEVPLAPEAALRLWTDTSRWPTFVEGFARVVELDPGWPAEGSTGDLGVDPGRPRAGDREGRREHARARSRRWSSRTACRAGRPSGSSESEGGALVELSLEYTLTSYGLLGPVADVIFIRRALRDSLRRTDPRFGVEAQEEAGLR